MVGFFNGIPEAFGWALVGALAVVVIGTMVKMVTTLIAECRDLDEEE